MIQCEGCLDEARVAGEVWTSLPPRTTSELPLGGLVLASILRFSSTNAKRAARRLPFLLPRTNSAEAPVTRASRECVRVMRTPLYHSTTVASMHVRVNGPRPRAPAFLDF